MKIDGLRPTNIPIFNVCRAQRATFWIFRARFTAAVLSGLNPRATGAIWGASLAEINFGNRLEYAGLIAGVGLGDIKLFIARKR